MCLPRRLAISLSRTALSRAALSGAAAAVSVGLLAAPASAAPASAAPASAVPASAASTNAEPGFAYWGYYLQTDGEWQASQEGAASLTPEDGSVEGWHYATTVGTQTNRPPRTDLTFADICAGTDAAGGQKRVAVVLDYGTAVDAPEAEQPPQPEAECAVVPQDATGAQVLEAVADVRLGEGGFTCGINGYPARACSAEIPDPQVPATEEPVDFALPAAATDDSSATDDSTAAAEDEVAGQGETPAESADDGLPWALIGVLALAAVILGAGVLVARRRG